MYPLAVGKIADLDKLPASRSSSELICRAVEFLGRGF